LLELLDFGDLPLLDDFGETLLLEDLSTELLLGDFAELELDSTLLEDAGSDEELDNSSLLELYSGHAVSDLTKNALKRVSLATTMVRTGL
jgi:hypothetical protein